MSKKNPTDLSVEENTPNRLICLTTVSSTARPFQLRNRYIPTIQTKSLFYSFPSFCFILQVFKKESRIRQKGCCLSHHLCSHKFDGNVSSSTITTLQEQSLEKLTKEDSSSICKQNFASTNMDYIREKHIKKGVSETATQLITKARSKSSRANYKSSWGMLVRSLCDKQQIIAFRCSVIHISDYLDSLYRKGQEYRTIACYRLAIYAFQDHIQVGKEQRNTHICMLY